MGWADAQVSKLLAGQTVQFRPYGNSMRPRILSGQLVTVLPTELSKSEIKIGDVVLARVRGKQYLHLVKDIRNTGGVFTFLVANNAGHENGWTGVVYGKVTRVEQ